MHYKRAPIREAIIGLQLDPSSVTLDELERFAESVAPDYPSREPTLGVNVAVDVAQRSTAASSSQNGFLCRSQKYPQLVQARLDYFLFSRLAPYERWEPFRDEARRLYELFIQDVPDARIVLIGVRYINVLSLPVPCRLEHYLEVYPEIRSRDVPIQNLFMRLEIPLAEVAQGIAIIQEAFTAPMKPDTIGLVFDIDVRVPRTANHDPWEQIDSLRPVKNRIFEESLTAKAKEDFDADVGA